MARVYMSPLQSLQGPRESVVQDNPLGQRLPRRHVLRLLAAGTGVSALMAATTSSFARTTLAAAPITFAQATGTNQLNVVWNASPPNLFPLNAVSVAQWTSFASMYSTLVMSDPQNQTYAPD